MSNARAFAIVVGVGGTLAVGCADMSPSRRSPTGATPLPIAERRVGDVDGGSPPDCGTDDCPERSLSLVAASGDTLTATCRGECGITGTGRFEGVRFNGDLDHPNEFELYGTSISVTLSIVLPRMNDLGIVTSGVLSAQVTVVPDSSCRSGQRQIATFAGVLPHLGRTVGQYSGCSR